MRNLLRSVYCFFFGHDWFYEPGENDEFLRNFATCRRCGLWRVL